jgi:hypothetical protein
MIGDLCEKYFVDQPLFEPPSEPVAVAGNASYHGRKMEKFATDT